MGVDRGNILAEHHGVAGAVGDIGEPLLLLKVEAEEHAVAALQAVAVGCAELGGPLLMNVPQHQFEPLTPL